MSISRQSVSTSTSFSTPYGKIHKVSDSIIIEDITGGQYDDETEDDPAYVRQEPSGNPSFVGAPTGGEAFDAHDLANTAVYTKGNEILVVEYPSPTFTDFTSAVAVTKYMFGNGIGEAAVVEINQGNDSIIVIDMLGV